MGSVPPPTLPPLASRHPSPSASVGHTHTSPTLFIPLLPGEDLPEGQLLQGGQGHQGNQQAPSPERGESGSQLPPGHATPSLRAGCAHWHHHRKSVSTGPAPAMHCSPPSTFRISRVYLPLPLGPRNHAPPGDPTPESLPSTPIPGTPHIPHPCTSPDSQDSPWDHRRL